MANKSDEKKKLSIKEQFAQQRIPGCRLLLSPRLIILLLLITGVIQIAIGTYFLLRNNTLTYFYREYDTPKKTVPGIITRMDPDRIHQPIIPLVQTFHFDKPVKGPLYLYAGIIDRSYAFKDISGNTSKNYSSSISTEQLRYPANVLDPDIYQSCNARADTADLHITDSVRDFADGTSSAYLYPCGLVPWFSFTDSYRAFIKRANGNEVTYKRDLIYDPEATPPTGEDTDGPAEESPENITRPDISAVDSNNIVSTNVGGLLLNATQLT